MVSLSPCGGAVAAGDYAGRVVLYDVGSGEVLLEDAFGGPPMVWAVALSWGAEVGAVWVRVCVGAGVWMWVSGRRGVQGREMAPRGVGSLARWKRVDTRASASARASPSLSSSLSHFDWRGGSPPPSSPPLVARAQVLAAGGWSGEVRVWHRKQPGGGGGGGGGGATEVEAAPSAPPDGPLYRRLLVGRDAIVRPDRVFSLALAQVPPPSPPIFNNTETGVLWCR